MICPNCGGNCDRILVAMQASRLGARAGRPHCTNVMHNAIDCTQSTLSMDKWCDACRKSVNEKEHPGAVCSDCGRTVTEAEYSYGEASCCKAGVVPEEEYGQDPAEEMYDDPKRQ